MSANNQGIEACIAIAQGKGLNGGLPVVCEGELETALGKAAVVSLKEQFSSAIEVFPLRGAALDDGSFCVIGTKRNEDNVLIRQRIDALKAVIG